MTRAALALLILAVGGVTVWILLRPGSPMMKWGAPAAVMDGEALALRGVRLYEKRKDGQVVELAASRSIMSLDETRTDLEEFTLVSRASDMGVLTLTAERGTMINATRDVTAKGAVVARDENGRALLTDSLTWKNSLRMIETDDKVKIFGEGFLITGRGLKADADTEQVEILSDVRAIFMVSDD
ncbi:MAG: LPS export ABC transporter periplasmic protein LptC [Candidatus Nitrospinota bacterium M3_3B_026]